MKRSNLLGAFSGIIAAGMLARGFTLLAANPPTTLPGDGPSRFQPLVAQLADPDFRVRDRAEADLEDADEAAIPFLEAAEKSDDPEVRLRAGVALKAIVGPRAPTLVTMDVADVSVDEALKVFSQLTGQPVEVNSVDRQRLARTNISLHVKDEPFWSVVLQICQRSGLQAAGIVAGQKAIHVTDLYGAWDHRIVSVHGPFVVSLGLMNRSSTVAYGKKKDEKSTVQLFFSAMAESHCHPLACRHMVITRCEDDAGKPLIVSGGLDEPFAGATMVNGGMNIQGSPRKIAVIDGTLEYVLQGHFHHLQIADCMKAVGAAQQVGNVHLQIRDGGKVGDGEWTVHVEIDREGRDDAAWEDLKQRLGENQPSLRDEAGAEIHAGKYPRRRQTDRGCQLDFDFNTRNPPSGGVAQVGEKLALVWDIPARQRSVIVPFHFENVAIP